MAVIPCNKVSIITEHTCFIVMHALNTMTSGIIDVSCIVSLSYSIHSAKNQHSGYLDHIHQHKYLNSRHSANLLIDTTGGK